MLAMFCKSHPSVQVRYQCSDFEFDDECGNSSLKSLQVGMALTVALKSDNAGKNAAIALLGWLSRVQDDLELACNWRETWNIEHLGKNVKNFAI
jgi:hypothetical protein